MASQGKSPLEVVTGPICGINSTPRETRFYGQLVGKDVESDSQILFMYEDANIKNNVSELVRGEFDDREIEETFRSCECHNPANRGKRIGIVGSKSCLALSKVKVQEI